MEMEEEFKNMVKQAQTDSDKNLYFQDLLESKEKELTEKKKEINSLSKKVQELNKVIEDSRLHRKSTSKYKSSYFTYLMLKFRLTA